MLENFIKEVEIFNYWVGCGGYLYHLPILIQVDKEYKKPLAPFKCNHYGLNEEEFRLLILRNLELYDPSLGDSFMFKFT